MSSGGNTWHDAKLTTRFGRIDGECNSGKWYVVDTYNIRHIVFKSWCTRVYF